MKAERVFSHGVAALLGFALSFGGVGCVATAFSLNIDSLGAVGMACGIFSLLCALCLGWKWSSRGLLCVIALGLGYFWRQGTLTASFSSLIFEVSRLYDRAYGWGTLGSGGAAPDLGLTVTGCAVALCAVWIVCRQRRALAAVIAALLPVMSCFVVTDTVPQVPFLFLLLLGLLLLVLTNYLRRDYPGQANTLTAIAAVPVSLTLGILFALLPQESYVNRAAEYIDTALAWVQDIPAAAEELSEELLSQLDGTQSSENLDLRSQGPRQLMHYPVMDVVPATSGSLYLREQSYDSYDGTGWRASAGQPETFGGGDIPWESAGVVTIATRQTRNLLCLPYYPREGVTLSGGNLENSEKTTVYEFLQGNLPQNWVREDWQAGDGPEGYLDLPAETEDWARALASQITAGCTTPEEKASAIAQFVRNAAQYDLNTPKMPDSAGDFARWFLEESDTGYCVHFATATAVLLRGAGVRSRYVTGYMTQGVQGQMTTVTAAQAHAWAEYFDPQLGIWRQLESTPASETGEAEGILPELTLPSSETAPQTGPEETEGPGPGIGTGTQAEPGDGDGTTGTDPTAAPAYSALLWLAGLAVLAVSALQWPLRKLLHGLDCRRGQPNRRALALWRQARRWGKAAGIPVPDRLEQLAQKAKYSQHTLTEEELAEFSAWFARARRALEKKSGALRFWRRWILGL